MSGTQMAWSLRSRLIERGGDGAAAGGKTRVSHCELGTSQGGMQRSYKASGAMHGSQGGCSISSRPSHKASVVKKGQVSTLIKLCVLR